MFRVDVYITLQVYREKDRAHERGTGNTGVMFRLLECG